jgi:hypothetical protein
VEIQTTCGLSPLCLACKKYFNRDEKACFPTSLPMVEVVSMRIELASCSFDIRKAARTYTKVKVQDGKPS